MLIPPLENFSDSEKSLILKFIELGQDHLFAHCTTPGDIQKIVFQLTEADRVLAPGGIADYILRGRKLLSESKNGINPFYKCIVSVPSGMVLDPASDEYERLETIGSEEIWKICFVLVAGGLGERLGYPGIKISLPVESQTGITYMQLFAQYILEFQRMAGNGVQLPLAIMTSADTHEKTIQLLEENAYYGLNPSQVTLMMQGKVPCFKDSDARIAVSESNDIDMKPHGHGDVHGLLLQTGLAQKWNREGRQWLFFFQDTNSLSMRALCACLGVSKEKNFAMNSLSVPRAPGEASGGICKLSYPTGRTVTISVEYNVLGPLLAPQGGDIADPTTGNSPFPGNCNILLFDLNQYVPALVKSCGIVPEFVNPKYTDNTKTAFKSPSRLECLMQDYALLLDGCEIGFCALPKWVTFSVVKNSTAEAIVKKVAGQPMDCALSGECEFYDSNCRILSIATRRAGFNSTGCDEKQMVKFGGLEHPLGPRVTLLPSFGATIKSIKDKVKGDINLLNGSRTSVVVAGNETEIGNVDINGSVVIMNEKILNKKIFNKGNELVSVSTDPDPAIAIRGFRVTEDLSRVMGI